jgi:hypothetical protein
MGAVTDLLINDNTLNRACGYRGDLELDGITWDLEMFIKIGPPTTIDLTIGATNSVISVLFCATISFLVATFCMFSSTTSTDMSALSTSS